MRSLLTLSLLTLNAACGSLIHEAERIRQKYEALNGNPSGAGNCAPPVIGNVTEVYTGVDLWRYENNGI